MKHTNLVLVAALALMIPSMPASAQLLGAGGSTTLDVSVTGSGASGTGSDTSGSASTSATVQIGEDTRTSNDSDMSQNDADARVQSGSVLDFSITRGDLEEGTQYDVTGSHEVGSMAALEAYAVASVRNDDRLDAISMANNRMEVTYRAPARFLGFIPSSVKTKISVSGDGEVVVDYPWYAFLFAKGESEAELASRLSAGIGDGGEPVGADGVLDANATSTLSVTDESERLEIRRWARILEQVHAALSVQTADSASAS